VKLKPFFQIDFEELAHRGIVEYLKNQLLARELACFTVGKKYGVRTIDDLDALLRSGKLKEEEVSEDDYIELAELQKEIRALKAAIAEATYGPTPA